MPDENPDNGPRPLNYSPDPGFHTPVRTSTIGMYLFLAALFMLFAAGLVGYIMVRVRILRQFPDLTVHVPKPLWVSTAIVVLASVTVQFAVRELRFEHQKAFRRWLLATMLLAIGFVIVQVPSMAELLSQKSALTPMRGAAYGLVFVLILLHAAHVAGGIISLAWTSVRAHRHAYDHENYHPVGRVALYWHFLDAVWLVMFFTFLFVG